MWWPVIVRRPRSWPPVPGATRCWSRALPPARLDLIIVATVTPEHVFPSTASLVQDALGAASAGAFDLSAGCSGFIYGLSMAMAAVRSGAAEHVLVIGAETLSRIVDWTDRNTCVLFGDGAGAVVVSACTERCGVLATELGSDGSGGDLLILPAGGSHQPASLETVSNGGHFVKMNGREVFRFATTVMPKATENVVRKAGWRARRCVAGHPAPGQHPHHRIGCQAARPADGQVLRQS